MTYGLVSVQGQALNTGKNNKERQTWDCCRVGGWPQWFIEVAT